MEEEMERKPLLMVTDDDSDDVFLFEEALKNIDPELNLLKASDGKQALEVLNNMLPELPDVLFLDINMPGMNGWESLERIKSNDQLKTLPVIIYSTSNSQVDIAMAFSLEAFCFCTKPDDFKDLVNLLSIVVNNYHSDKLEIALRACNECKTLHFPDIH